MEAARLDSLLNRFSSQRVLVIGDFFLDKYLIIDRQLSETSLETGLEAYQVVDIRCSPGAAGTVVSNLRSLGVNVTTLGVIGDDGQGYELKRGLQEGGSDTAYLIETPSRFTPTYTKPIVLEPAGAAHEIERLDIKNRQLLPSEMEDAIIDSLRKLLPQVQGVVIGDQVQEANCGVITDRVRSAISDFALHNPEVIFIADSRARIGLLRNVMIKPNAKEALHAIYPEQQAKPSLAQVKQIGRQLYARNRKPVFMTMGEEGILLFSHEDCQHIPAVPVSGEIDIVGAGDSCIAGIVSALCSGAELLEAAWLGNVVASITIQQIGTTGTANPSQIRARFQQISSGNDIGDL
jgi:rfaE bifunctional protein kinase chain/domain